MGTTGTFAFQIPIPTPLSDARLLYAVQNRPYALNQATSLQLLSKDVRALAPRLAGGGLLVQTSPYPVMNAQARADFLTAKQRSTVPDVARAYTNFLNYYSPACSLENFFNEASTPVPDCEDYWEIDDYAWNNIAPALYYWNGSSYPSGNLVGIDLLVDSLIEIDAQGNMAAFADAEVVNGPAGGPLQRLRLARSTPSRLIRASQSGRGTTPIG